MAFLRDLPRFVFFTGKGGVGKTSVACATALTLADRGKRVLLVSTDPASNVAQVFGQPIGHSITPLESAPGVDALEIDPDAAAAQYRETIIGPVRNLLPAAEIASMTEQLSGSCTTEIASFNEFTDLLAEPARTAGYDHVVFDTAPTGHTIRLLQLPGDWTKFIDDGAGDASCLGPMSGLDKRREVYSAAVDALANPEHTRLVLVARAQESTLQEVDRTRVELEGVGLANQYLVINAVMPETGDGDPLVAAVRRREQEAIANLPEGVAALPRDVIELRPWNIMGVANLHDMFRLGSPAAATAERPAHHTRNSEWPSVGSLVDSLEEQGHGLVMFMGKGGVGKTTMAHAVALALAARGHGVLLTSTDPAGRVGSSSYDQFPNLRVERIDSRVALAEYTSDVLRSKGSRLDEAGRQQLLEDLRSPCTEEVAVFRQFSAAIRQARRKFVIMDTAPTGHTLLLLDATGSYHRDVVRQLGADAHVTTPMMMLQDPTFTRLCIVTLPESTPVLEAEQLQADLARAGIRPWAWVVNNSVAAADPDSPFLRAIAANEAEQIARVQSLAERSALVPLLAEPPVEPGQLLDLVDGVPEAGREPVAG
ncbi:arsenical pump-driving ATPase [Tessaracoccus sp. OS52]|uniref:arsenical pump-driving ATPase n=1 Tax=Tessaracoccus sp. OS52 TaxID=2886691 RepID=UPI001D1282FC|nr:arsenical pump-driving ATPase [Tessaracoccus sp. OS52]MCC2593700.1 arsenical pump-driving ATPase [Tessaracoccus sp. OS52]